MKTIIDPTVERTAPRVTTEIKAHHTRFLILGIVMLIAGTAAIIFPFFASLAVELLIGWVLLFSGIAGIVHAFSTRKWNGFVLSLLIALLSLGVGIVLLIYPLTGLLSLTLLITVFFLAGGIIRIVLALKLRPFDHWGWLLFGGILDLILATLIITQWPEAAALIVGLLVGIDLIFTGWIMLLLASATHRLV